MENTNFERDIRRGEIYWIEQKNWSSTEGSVQRVNRPGIIVSNDKNNLHAPIAQIVMTTTNPKKDLPTHTIIRSTYQPSTVLCEQIQTIDKDQIGSYIGTCTDTEMEMIEQCILISLGINQAAVKMPEPATLKVAPSKEWLDEQKVKNEALKTELKEENTKLKQETDWLNAELRKSEQREREANAKLVMMQEELNEASTEASKYKQREELLKEMYNDLLKQSIK